MMLVWRLEKKDFIENGQFFWSLAKALSQNN